MFRKLGFVVAKSEVEAVCNCEPGAVERVLKLVKVKMDQAQRRGLGTAAAGSRPEEADDQV